ncbi:hypothetical protein Lepto7375DRAFT_3749 [Leptolyngbya sp. PCC 7375]|nr:hypothetical protein Lepto7375DRAFT_3749 [Leptolyngbya sp. PCC 7375]
MSTFTTQTYNLLMPGLLFNITPALPPGSPGVRRPVGTPETIPSVTFITRQVVAADGFAPAERQRFNGYIREARAYHSIFGLVLREINSLEDIVNYFDGEPGPIDRVRILSHGNDELISVPFFNNGSWQSGIQSDMLRAFQSNDEEGLRYLISLDRTQSPLFVNSVAKIVNGIRVLNNAVLAPFGLNNAGLPSGDMESFFDIINDHYQLRHSVVLVQRNQPNPQNITNRERIILTNSLNLLENAIRNRLINTRVGGTVLTADHLNALETAVMGATPTQLGFFGQAQNLAATVLADLATVMNAAPRREVDLRNAIVANINEPMFPNNTGRIYSALSEFSPTALYLTGARATMESIGANPHLRSFFLICNDLFFLGHGQISIAGNRITAAQRTSLRNGLLAIANIIAARVVAGPGGIVAGRLTRFRRAIEGLTTQQTLNGQPNLLNIDFRDLQAANTSLANRFRAKLNHMRAIMQAASNIDIRGCRVGATPNFLDTLRDFLGTGVRRPTVSAPDWLQSYPRGLVYRWGRNIYGQIDQLVANGIGAITGADVVNSFNIWRGLVDFDPHYAFIQNLFAAAQANLFDFVTQEWCVWRVGQAPIGIPILRIQAERIDDIAGLNNLGRVIERFGIVFEVPGSIPNAAIRQRLILLQPHIINFKAIRTRVAAAAAPTPADLTQFFNQLSLLARNMVGIPGIIQPNAPIMPNTAPNPLTLVNIQNYIGNFQVYIDRILNNYLGVFFAAVRNQTGHQNAAIRYCLNIGIPIPIQSNAQPRRISIVACMSANNNAQGSTFIANVIKSWLKVQWTGSAAEMTAMNNVVNALAIRTAAQRNAATRVCVLSEDVPPRAVFNPLPGFQAHIITRPIP